MYPPVALPMERPRPMVAYVRLMMAATTESAVACDRLGIWEKTIWQAPKMMQYCQRSGLQE